MFKTVMHLLPQGEKGKTPPLWGRCPAGQRGAPVRRHSRERGRCEAGFWRPVSRRSAWRIVDAAKRFDRARKQPGRKNGPLGHVAIEILELFASVVDFRSGRLEPSIDYMQRKLCRSRAAIVEALARLRLRGFLDWIRRYETTGEEGRGQPPRQVTNAYRLVLPVAAAILLGILGQEVPLPDDVEIAQAERSAEIHAQERQDFEDSPLGISLAQLRENIRKFTGRSEPRSDSNSLMEK